MEFQSVFCDCSQCYTQFQQPLSISHTEIYIQLQTRAKIARNKHENNNSLNCKDTLFCPLAQMTQKSQSINQSVFICITSQFTTKVISWHFSNGAGLNHTPWIILRPIISPMSEHLATVARDLSSDTQTHILKPEKNSKLLLSSFPLQMVSPGPHYAMIAYTHKVKL